MSLADPNENGLDSWGWGPDWHDKLKATGKGLSAVGRVTIVWQRQCQVLTADGLVDAVLPGRAFKRSAPSEDADPWARRPAVGDWVVLRRHPKRQEFAVDTVLPRKTKLSRQSPGKVIREQVLAANVDFVWLVQGLDVPVNGPRLERFSAAVRDGGAEPAVVLTKTDLCDDVSLARQQAEQHVIDAQVWPVCALSGEGLAPVEASLQPGQTVALIGLSGAGKSTLINALLGADELKTASVREGDRKGRHTTTHRELFRLPCGAIVIDSPGIREFQLWDAGGGLSEAFEDIESLSVNCRFRDCGHTVEPGCAVREAVVANELSSERLASYHKLSRESETRRRGGEEVPLMAVGRRPRRMGKDTSRRRSGSG